MVNDLGYEGIKFPVSKKEFGKIEKKNNICINAFCYRNNSVYPVDVSNRKFKNCMDLLLITESKVLADLCAIRQNVKIKQTFVDIVYGILVVKKFW